MNIDILITNPYFLFFIGFLGMITHFLKQYQKDVELRGNTKGRIDGFFYYFFKKNLTSTISSIIAYIVGYFIAYQLKELTIISMFGVGYMCDSLFNKVESKSIE